jgi:hypothetical protein
MTGSKASNWQEGQGLVTSVGLYLQLAQAYMFLFPFQQLLV